MNVRITIGFLAVAMISPSARAERYLTVEQAQKTCFPQAERFEAQTVRFTPEQAKAVEKRSGVKVQNKGNRIWLAMRGSEMLGVLFVDYVLGKHEIIDYAVAVVPGGKVTGIEVLEYRESYGWEIRGNKWREQFHGKTAANKLKLNQDIYNISGATISCRNVCEGVKRVLATFEEVVRPRLVADGKLPGTPASP